jgi:hypothetical protein
VPIDSEVYQVIKSLYIARGLALPSTTGPWSEAELLLMLGRIDSEALSPDERRAYDFAAAELAAEHGVFKLNITPTVEIHAHANTEDFVTPDQYIRPVNLTKPLLAFSTEARLTDYIYIFGALDVGNKIINTRVTASNGVEYPGSTLYGQSAFSTNIPFVPPSQGAVDVDGTTPHRALLSVGASAWNLVVGRDRLSWGPGQSGNFMVGSHVDYHDNARLGVWGDFLKYTFNFSSFTYPGEYFGNDPRTDGYVYDPSRGWDPLQSPWEVKGFNFFIAHRLEARVWKLNFALTEAVMHQGRDGNFDPAVLLPMMVLHNLNRVNELNSLVTLEADYTVIPGLNIYAQVAMDEFQIPGGEDSATETATAQPNVMAYMLGVQTAFPIGSRLFSASIEGVYTDPYLYLRAFGHDDQRVGELGVNYVVANRQHSSIFMVYEEFLGYRWGGDAIVLNAHAEVRAPGAWNIGLNIMFMIHGTFDKWTTFDNNVYASNDLGNYPQNATPTTSGQGTENHADPNSAQRDAPYYLTAVSFLGSVNLPWLKGFSLYGQADLVYVVNPGNLSYNPPATDLQLTMGVSYAF